MSPETVRRLNAINRRFYAERAEEFSQTRERPWQGWDALYDRIQHSLPSRPRVLDLGCGNGRFARFLRERLPSFTYVGVDASPTALEFARQKWNPRHGIRVEWIEHDFIVEDDVLPARVRSQEFDLAVLFGVLHHVPGRKTRKQVLTALAERLSPGGLLAFTAWSFDRFERFRKKLVAWNALAEHNLERPDPSDLEPGDYLMTWGADKPGLRYCHALRESEARDLESPGGLTSIDRFDGDSGLNEYFVARRDELSSSGRIAIRR